jgi:L-ascorbate metabolism protein UlaG (beta-lactamase superfamily)
MIAYSTHATEPQTVAEASAGLEALRPRVLTPNHYRRQMRQDAARHEASRELFVAALRLGCQRIEQAIELRAASKREG